MSTPIPSASLRYLIKSEVTRLGLRFNDRAFAWVPGIESAFRLGGTPPELERKLQRSVAGSGSQPSPLSRIEVFVQALKFVHGGFTCLDRDYLARMLAYGLGYFLEELDDRHDALPGGFDDDRLVLGRLAAGLGGRLDSVRLRCCRDRVGGAFELNPKRSLSLGGDDDGPDDPADPR